MPIHADKRDLEVDLAELLSDLSNVQEELLTALVEKRDHMAAGDLDAMTAVQRREEELCQRLQACHERRAGLLDAAAQDGADVGSLEKLASLISSDERGNLTKQVKEASSRMRLLGRHCLTNWVLAQRTLLHLSQILEIVATGGRLQPTYGKGEGAAARGALVDREA